MFSLVGAQERSLETTSLTTIDEGWKTKTIDNVINGSFGIMLERFDQTWPTWMVGAVRETMEGEDHRHHLSYVLREDRKALHMEW